MSKIRIDVLQPTLNPQRDHEMPAMRDGISNKLRVEQILSLLQASDIPGEAVTLAKLAADAKAATGHTFDDAAAQLGETNVQKAIEAVKVLADIGASLEENSVGKVDWFARNTAPTGWLKSNGAAVSRTTYSRLFAAIGTTFGSGDGSTTFNLPDLRGEFIRGWDDGRGVDSGRSFGSTQGQAIQSHTHTLGAAILNTAGGAVGLASGPIGLAQGGPSGSTGGPETRPRNVALLACIKF